jgi:hypothetical protein
MATKTHPRIYVRVSPSEYKVFKMLKENGITVRQAFEKLGEHCVGYPISLFNKETGEPILIHKPLIITKKNRS